MTILASFLFLIGWILGFITTSRKFWQKKLEPPKPKPFELTLSLPSAAIKPVARRFRVPDDRALEIIKLYDTANIAINTTKGGRAESYVLWKAIEEIFPETKEGWWHLEIALVTEVYIQEKLKD